MHYYRVFNLIVSSELPCPTLIEHPAPKAADITVALGGVPLSLPGHPHPNAHFQGQPNQALLRVKDTARFWIQDGNSITIELAEDADLDKVRLFLLGSAFGALLAQRGLCILHANAIVINKHAILFSGPSGIGKSTLAAAFHQQGHQLLTDDTAVIQFDDHGQPWVLPAYPHIKLWDDALAKLQLTSPDKTPIFGRENKYMVGMAHTFATQAYPLRGFYQLETADQATVTLTSLKGLAALEALQKNVYRAHYLKPMGLLKQHFEHGAQLTKQVDTYTLTRPQAGFWVQEIANMIKEKYRD